MSELEPSAYCDAFADRLRRLGLEPVLIGALAASRYRASPRFTTDADFLVRSVEGLAEAMMAEGYEVRTMTQRGEDEPYVVFIRGKGVSIDVLRAETPFEESAIDRAVDGVITAEDVIVFKLLAWRPRDQDDVASILEAGGDLDTRYIDRWAGGWQVTDRWEEALRRFRGPA